MKKTIYHYIIIDIFSIINVILYFIIGLEEDDLWVVSYKVSFSLDNVTWDYVRDKETGDLVSNLSVIF